MERQIIEAYRRRLLREREDLIALVARTEHDGRTAEQEGTQDLADKAASAYTKEFLFHQSSNERTVLQMIDEALSRLTTGGFGDCLQCGKPMEARRLEAVPWARYCIPCQQDRDNGGHQEVRR